MKEADSSTPPLVSLIAGGTAGGIEATLTYPFEYAKTRVQLRGEYAPKNPFAVVGKVIREEGVRALYMGCGTLVAVGGFCSLLLCIWVAPEGESMVEIWELYRKS